MAEATIRVKVIGDNLQFVSDMEKTRKSVDGVKESVNNMGRTLDVMNRSLKVIKWDSIVNLTHQIMRLTQSAWNLTDQFAKFDQQKIAFDNLAISYGTSADKMLIALKKISDGTIDTMTLIEKAGTAMMMGITPDKITKLMEIARSTARMTGQDVSTAFSDIALAVGRQSKMILDNLGIIVSVEKANEQYAKSIGKTAIELTDAEKKLAFMNATITAGDELMLRLGKQTDTLRDKMLKLKSMQEDMKLFFGEVIARGALAAFGGLQYLAAGILGLISAYAKYRAFIYELFGDQTKALINKEFSKLIKEERDKLLKEAEDMLKMSMSKLSMGTLPITRSEKELKKEKLEKKEIDYSLYDLGVPEVKIERERIHLLDIELELTQAITQSYIDLSESEQKALKYLKQSVEEADEQNKAFNEMSQNLFYYEEQLLNAKKIIASMAGDWESVKKIEQELLDLEKQRIQLLSGISQEDKNILKLATEKKAFSVQELTQSQEYMVSLNDQVADQFTYLLPNAVDIFTDSIRNTDGSFKSFFKSMEVGFLKLIEDIALAILKMEILRSLGYGEKGSSSGGLISGAIGLVGGLLGITKAQHGFEGVVTKPTLFLTGEGGQAEHVKVTPGNRMDMGRGNPTTILIGVTAIDALSFVELSRRNPQGFLQALGKNMRNMGVTRSIFRSYG